MDADPTGAIKEEADVEFTNCISFFPSSLYSLIYSSIPYLFAMKSVL